MFSSTRIVLLILPFCFINATPQNEYENNRPIIGVLTQEHKNGGSYIAASYVKFLEGSGARVVPIWIGQKRTYYESLMGKLNGVLFPGGSAWFTVQNGYADAAYHIYEIAKEMNDNGTHFPVIGVCLGFEVLIYFMGNRTDVRERCNAEGIALRLDFTPNYKRSKMFEHAPEHIINLLEKYNLTTNSHHFCNKIDGLAKVGIQDKVNVLSTSKDENGLEFISIIETKQYPFYGLQFHPEKNIYEWIKKPGRKISHSKRAIEASQYFGNFFVNEARKNNNTFDSNDEESRHLIYNYNPKYTAGRDSSYFVQMYFFQKNPCNPEFYKFFNNRWFFF